MVSQRSSAQSSGAVTREHGGTDAHLDTELLEACAFVDGWHQSHLEPAWDSAKKRWKQFSKTVPFWAA